MILKKGTKTYRVRDSFSTLRSQALVCCSIVSEPFQGIETGTQ